MCWERIARSGWTRSSRNKKAPNAATFGAQTGGGNAKTTGGQNAEFHRNSQAACPHHHQDWGTTCAHYVEGEASSSSSSADHLRSYQGRMVNISSAGWCSMMSFSPDEVELLRRRLAANPETLIDPAVVARLLATLDNATLIDLDFEPFIPQQQATL